MRKPMAEIQSDLIGKWVRKKHDYTRGIVRAIFLADNQLQVLVQIRHNKHDYDCGELETWSNFEISSEWQ
jgi:hypothetical protein